MMTGVLAFRVFTSGNPDFGQDAEQALQRLQDLAPGSGVQRTIAELV